MERIGDFLVHAAAFRDSKGESVSSGVWRDQLSLDAHPWRSAKIRVAVRARDDGSRVRVEIGGQVARLVRADAQVWHRSLRIDRERISDPADEIFRLVGKPPGDIGAATEASQIGSDAALRKASAANGMARAAKNVPMIAAHAVWGLSAAIAAREVRYAADQVFSRGSVDRPEMLSGNRRDRPSR